MKIENIGRAHELIEQREKLLDIIEKLETDEISFVDGAEKSLKHRRNVLSKILKTSTRAWLK